MRSQTSPHSPGLLSGLLAAVAVLICFFLPWIEISVSFARATMSGYQIATGSGPAGIKTPSWPPLLLIPLSMLAAAALAGLSLFQQSVAPRLVALVLITAGGLSAALLTYQHFDLNAQFNQNLFGLIAQNLVSYVFGWGASLLGSLAVLGGGLLEWRNSANAPVAVPAPQAGAWRQK